MSDMILPQPKDALHKAWLYRLLTGIYDDAFLADRLRFKGGTCAALLGYLDRFSVDLDFDFVGDQESVTETRARLETLFRDLGLVIKDCSRVVPQYFLKYDAKDGERNTLKVDVTVPPPQANRYEPKRFHEIDRIIVCQTVETMMANKLVALMDRYARTGAIAGRDLYDIHSFLLQGFRYDADVIRERTGKTVPAFFADLVSFIEQHVTDEIVTQDLNVLLPYGRFRRLRKVLKSETLLLLRDEMKRIASRERGEEDI